MEKTILSATPSCLIDVAFLGGSTHIPKEKWSACIEQLIRVVRPSGKLIITLDMSSADVNAYKDIIRYSRLKFPVDIDHSTPANIRHPDWTYETVGLVMTKEKE